MKTSRFTETQIISVLQRNERGEKVADLCRELEISAATFYNWSAKYGGLDVNQLRRLKELETENSRLKTMYAELSLVHHALKDAVSATDVAGQKL
jgi:putative transposase